MLEYICIYKFYLLYRLDNIRFITQAAHIDQLQNEGPYNTKLIEIIHQHAKIIYNFYNRSNMKQIPLWDLVNKSLSK